MSYFPPMIKPY